MYGWCVLSRAACGAAPACHTWGWGWGWGWDRDSVGQGPLQGSHSSIPAGGWRGGGNDPSGKVCRCSHAGPVLTSCRFFFFQPAVGVVFIFVNKWLDFKYEILHYNLSLVSELTEPAGCHVWSSLSYVPWLRLSPEALTLSDWMAMSPTCALTHSSSDSSLVVAGLIL